MWEVGGLNNFWRKKIKDIFLSFQRFTESKNILNDDFWNYICSFVLFSLNIKNVGFAFKLNNLFN